MMRTLLCSALAVFFVAACGSDGSSTGTGSSTGSGGTGGASSATGAQVRFRYQASWKDHLGTCTSISNYRIKFGATPTPITVPIDVTAESLSQYVALEGRTYKDADVLHLFTCGTATQELYGRFGADLAFAPSKH